jgi:hypothetical protein
MSSLTCHDCHEDSSVIELVRQYLAIVRKGTLAPSDEADLERIYMEALRQHPSHRLVQIHEMTLHGVSFNVAEQLRDLLAEEITALDPISLPEEPH